MLKKAGESITAAAVAVSSIGSNPNPNKVVIRSLLRSLLRLGRNFDRSPASKLVLYRKSTGAPNFGTTGTGAALDICYNSILSQIYGLESSAYFLNPDRVKELNLYSIVRNEFRKESENYTAISERVDFAFAIIKKYSSIYNSYIESFSEKSSRRLNKVNNDDPQQQQQPLYTNHVDKLVDGDDESGSEHELSIKKKMNDVTVSNTQIIEPGVLMLAHPMVHGELHRAVVLILEHNKSGSYGVVINSTTDLTLSNGVKNLPTELINSFGRNVLFKGGIVRRLQCIHPFPNCGGTPIKKYTGQPTHFGGDIKKLIDHIVANPEDAGKVKFFAGCCVWDPGVLEEEVKSGYWIPAVSQKTDVMLFDNHRVIYDNNNDNDSVNSNVIGNNTNASNDSDDRNNHSNSSSSSSSLDSESSRAPKNIILSIQEISEVTSDQLPIDITELGSDERVVAAAGRRRRGGRNARAAKSGDLTNFKSPIDNSSSSSSSSSNSSSSSSSSGNSGNSSSNNSSSSNMVALSRPIQYHAPKESLIPFECINIELWDWSMAKLGYEECRTLPPYASIDDIESVDLKLE